MCMTVEIKDFLMKRFFSKPEFDNLCLELGITNIYDGNADDKVTSLLHMLDQHIGEGPGKKKLYTALIKLRPAFKEEIDRLFKTRPAPSEDDFLKRIRERIAGILDEWEMKEFCDRITEQLRENGNNDSIQNNDDIAGILVASGVFAAITLIIKTIKRYALYNNDTTAKKKIDSIWDYLRKILGNLVHITVDKDWLDKNIDTFKNEYNVFQIDLPAITDTGAEIIRSVLFDQPADFYTDAKKCKPGVHARNIIGYEPPESGVIPGDILIEIKMALYQTLIPEEPITHYSDEAEEKLKIRLKIKNELNEHKFLLLKNNLFRKLKVDVTLKQDLPPLNIITLSANRDITIFSVSEVELKQYINEFFSKKPDLKEKDNR